MLAEMARPVLPAAPEAVPDLAPYADYLRCGTARGIRWTMLREEVLALLWADPRPWNAYQIAGALGSGGPRPNSVYRALKPLEEAGLILPIVSRNRHIVSPDPWARDWGVMLCASCGRAVAVRMPGQQARLRELCAARGFRPARTYVECVGRCEGCG